MGIKEEETGNVVDGPAIIGEPWWLITGIDGTDLCCHRASAWFEARKISKELGTDILSPVLLERNRIP